MAYSVSPILRRTSSGGKNRLKRSTRMPTALAAKKWPASCRITSAAKPRKASSQLTGEPSGQPLTRRHRGSLQASLRGCSRRVNPLRDQLAGELAGLGVGHIERLEVVHAVGAELLEHLLDHRGDAGEAQAAVEEGVHRDLVGGVERARRRAAGERGLARQAQAREG